MNENAFHIASLKLMTVWERERQATQIIKRHGKNMVWRHSHLIPEPLSHIPCFDLILTMSHVAAHLHFLSTYTHTVYFSLHLIKKFLDKIAFSLLNHSTLFSLYTLYTTTQPIAFDLIFFHDISFSLSSIFVLVPRKYL